MLYFKILLFIGLYAMPSFGQTSDDFRIFNSKGKKISVQKMLTSLDTAKYVFFGELHNEVIAHTLECTVFNYLYSIHKERLVAGAEMFESDNQQGITDYVEGKISEDSLAKCVRLWPNHKTDYQPLLEIAKAHNLKFIATNVPRRYASRVFKQGIDSVMRLPQADKQFIAPMPFAMDTTLASYKSLLNFGDRGGINFVMAQAIKDATMAYFTYINTDSTNVFYHVNGSFHSNFNEGIVWHLIQKDPKAAIITIAFVTQKKLKKLEKANKKLADFMIVVLENSPKSYEDE